MGSPEDEAIGLAKKRRLMKLEKEKAMAAAAKPAGSLSIGECDLGASPQMSKGKLAPVKKTK